MNNHERRIRATGQENILILSSLAAGSRVVHQAKHNPVDSGIVAG